MNKVSNKNYYFVLLVSILVIIFTLYVRSFYLSYVESKKNSSIFIDKSVKQINVHDMKFALDEANDVLLFVSYGGNLRIYNNEKKIYRELEKKMLLDKVIYWNVTDYSEEEYIRILNNNFTNINNKIGLAPILIYIENGEAVDAISSNNGLIGVDELNKMLNKYGIE